MKQYRSIPTVITAEQFKGTLPCAGVQAGSFYTDPGDLGGRRLHEFYFVTTIQGVTVPVKEGEWIIQEPGNPERYYPCDNEVFLSKYVEVGSTTDVRGPKEEGGDHGKY